jgi:hypothetical protein
MKGTGRSVTHIWYYHATMDGNLGEQEMQLISNNLMNKLVS